MKRGFSLLEVIVALLLLEVAVLAAAGTLQVASRTLGEAERMERAVADAEGVLDSLIGGGSAAAGSRPFRGGRVEWLVDDSGALSVHALSVEGDTLVHVVSSLVVGQ